MKPVKLVTTSWAIGSSRELDPAWSSDMSELPATPQLEFLVRPRSSLPLSAPISNSIMSRTPCSHFAKMILGSTKLPCPTNVANCGLSPASRLHIPPRHFHERPLQLHVMLKRPGMLPDRPVPAIANVAD
ncbi:hypothetical protein PC116_g12122 [Phytophthora cactorum]|uniref:Uncharacterized protein n=1 Tax=Phytophthora cactorum TaxID=29920 RepID=A0A8T1DRC6_9STRA|nr:hypothetical protein Pcac1_g8027 [Phytophthora cactorum]KAG2911041.1 hypothetical protein PC114_g9551 [Phytophthora cactorum]KAG2943498.1 hypothetical protein PC117_g9435 [Phytophthora cactorum]KAG3006604.1 hypothetical protein PC120_g17263 [Phytophthora cactorum]KAG3023035.1 hypothetical protein PC119_g9043 [Phytophthora cactorum]